jgi:hypothetical protein
MVPPEKSIDVVEQFENVEDDALSEAVPVR